jgi:uncharacterized protein
MSDQSLDYPKIVERALKGVVREALDQVAEHGLPGAHHFFLTFRTDADGVEIPDFLRAQYDGEMTIVLQHQFWGLEVDEDGFAVTLSFKGRGERLVVPFDALVGFVDPHVKFGLQFHTEGVEPAAVTAAPAAGAGMPPADPPGESRDAGGPDDTPAAPEAIDAGASVVPLDAFRKK